LATIKIGMAGWIERTTLYPKGIASPEAKLGYYSKYFPIVEVDTTYYAFPERDTMSNWARWTSDDFTFNVKAHSILTHHYTGPKTLPQRVRNELPTNQVFSDSLHYDDLPEPATELLWNETDESLRPLYDAGKLGVVLFQFPATFHASRTNVDFMIECQRRLPDYHVGVELRHFSWFANDDFPKMLKFLNDNRLLYVGVDTPQGLESSVPPVVDSLGDFCVVRFHGRNAAGWEMTGPGSKQARSDYLYSDREIEEWRERIREIESQVKEVHLILNVNQAPETIYRFADIFGEGIKGRPSMFL